MSAPPSARPEVRGESVPGPRVSRYPLREWAADLGMGGEDLGRREAAVEPRDRPAEIDRVESEAGLVADQRVEAAGEIDPERDASRREDRVGTGVEEDHVEVGST